MKRFRRAFIAWCYGMVGGCIGGGASALGSWGGLAGAHAAGVDVPTLNFKGMGVIFLSGVVTHAVMFMMKSPLPPLEFDDSTPPFPLPDGSNTIKPKDQ